MLGVLFALRIDAGRQDIHELHVVFEGFGVVLGDFPDGFAFASRAFFELVFAFVGVGDEMADVGDVHDVVDCEARGLKGAAEGVAKDGVAEVADVVVIVDGGAAGVEGDFAGFLRLEVFDLAGEGVVETDFRRC